MVMDSEGFYNTVLDLLEDAEEQEEVHELLVWWNRCVTFRKSNAASEVGSTYRQIFPNPLLAGRVACKNSVVARIRGKRLERMSASARDRRP